MELKYEMLCKDGRKRYTAFIKNCLGTVLVLGKAKHFNSYGKQHVRAVVITSSEILQMADIGNHFVNLSALAITDCRLTHIRKSDFVLFGSGLVELILSDNLIRSLPSDLFDHTSRLKHLSFRNNEIQSISKHTLTPLTYLEYADFRGNDTIDEIYDSTGKSPNGLTLCNLRAKIVLQCKPSDEEISTVASYVQALWQGLFSDFEIKANEEVFQVHKAVLAANSPVFAAMFSHEMEENVKNEMTIKNYLPETVKELLAFVPKKCFKTFDLFAMAEEYQIKELSEQIQWHVSVEITGENATELFKFGVLYNNQWIREAAFQVIEESLNRKLPQELTESGEVMMELLEVRINWMQF